jgi:hypothetical protein
MMKQLPADGTTMIGSHWKLAVRLSLRLAPRSLMIRFRLVVPILCSSAMILIVDPASNLVVMEVMSSSLKHEESGSVIRDARISHSNRPPLSASEITEAASRLAVVC